MELKKASDRIWYTAYEEEKDRPALGYIKGDKFSVAVDAGHSGAHVREFYEALEREGLPLPLITVITHWHWDHSFGMHAVNGATAANSRTDQYLREAAERIGREGTDWFFAMDASIQKEYADGQEVKVVPADCVFQHERGIDIGGAAVIMFQTISPHTDDCTLVWVPQEKVLFLGDACGGEFPSWEVDPGKMKLLVNSIQMTDADICIPGHSEAVKREELLQTLKTEGQI